MTSIMGQTSQISQKLGTHFSLSSDSSTFEEQLAGEIRNWMKANDEKKFRSFKASLKKFLRKTLRTYRSHYGRFRLRGDRSARGADFAIGDRIGVKIISNLSSGSKHWLSREIAIMKEKYNSLFFIGYQIQPQNQDIWRSIKRKNTNTTDNSVIFITNNAEKSYKITVMLSVLTLGIFVVPYLFGGSFLYLGYLFQNVLMKSSNEAGMFAGGVIILLFISALYCVYTMRT